MTIQFVWKKRTITEQLKILSGSHSGTYTSRDADASFFLCKELIPGYLDGITGVYQTPQGYYVSDEDVEEFDKDFPPKEKLKLPGQIF